MSTHKIVYRVDDTTFSLITDHVHPNTTLDVVIKTEFQEQVFFSTDYEKARTQLLKFIQEKVNILGAVWEEVAMLEKGAEYL